MNKKDRENLHTLIELANKLMNAPAKLPGEVIVSNADVVEAMIEDILNALAGNSPVELRRLVVRDNCEHKPTIEHSLSRCKYGCKNYTCACEKAIELLHNSTYGCPTVSRCDCPNPEEFHYRGCAFLIENFKAFTADNVEITDGMAVWDYNLRPGFVSLKYLSDDGWFSVCAPGEVRASTMNAERVWTRHPRTGDLASNVLKGN